MQKDDIKNRNVALPLHDMYGQPVFDLLTFMDYNNYPIDEFIIPDIFDNSELSVALGRDLPDTTKG